MAPVVDKQGEDQGTCSRSAVGKGMVKGNVTRHLLSFNFLCSAGDDINFNLNQESIVEHLVNLHQVKLL